MKLRSMVVLVLASVAPGCTREAPRICLAHTVRSCECDGGGAAGTQACDDDGRAWEDCRCDGLSPPPPERDPPAELAQQVADNAPLVVDSEGVTVLPPPRTTGGMPLMEALAARHSNRELADKALPARTISDLLWAAAGVNRPESGKRTAPSARNRQEIELYVTTEAGSFLYDHQTHSLKTLGTADIRALTGKQPFVGKAPLNLVYVADLTKMAETSEEDLARYSGADAAFMAENAYLYATSAGLGVVVRGWIDREALGRALGLGDDRLIVLAQTFGVPAAPSTPDPPE